MAQRPPCWAQSSGKPAWALVLLSSSASTPGSFLGQAWGPQACVPDPPEREDTRARSSRKHQAKCLVSARHHPRRGRQWGRPVTPFGVWARPTGSFLEQRSSLTGHCCAKKEWPGSVSIPGSDTEGHVPHGPCSWNSEGELSRMHPGPVRKACSREGHSTL